MLVEIALADAFGGGYEFVDATPTTFEYAYHPSRPGYMPGRYSDDAQMSLANAEAMLACEEPSMVDFADNYCDCFWRDQRKGYARGFQAFLESTRTGTEFIRKIKPHSVRSGSAMRAVPLGLYPSVEKVIQMARLQAVLTHNTDGGIHAAMAVALAAHYLYNRVNTKKLLGLWLSANTGLTFWSKRYEEVYPDKPHPGNDGMQCALAAITCVVVENSFSTAVMRAVRMGGDTDTVAAIVGGLASLSSEMKQDVPDALLRDLENGAYGRDYLAEIDRRLFERFPRKPQDSDLAASMQRAAADLAQGRGTVRRAGERPARV